MATVLSLKDHKETISLKDQIRELEEAKQQLQQQVESQKAKEARLRDDILEHKKDFEHLEKQFDHFAGLEAEYEALQEQVQVERLETMLQEDKQDNQLKKKLKKAQDDLRKAQAELKEMKALDPQRLKRQVVDLKKKSTAQATDIKTLNATLVGARKDLKEATSEKEQLESDLNAARTGSDHFWLSEDAEWALYETTLQLKDEAEAVKRVRCINLINGLSLLSSGLDDKDLAQWLGDQEIPANVSKEAGKRLKKISAEMTEEETPA